ncbi:MAG: metal ABC transporter permease [Phycisphaerae bacterium]
MDPFFYLVILAGAIAGASTGLLGVYIVGMRMPFIGTCISHAAMAGSIFAVLLGQDPMTGAIAASVLASLSLGANRPHKSRVETNVGLAIIFSLMLGLTFLGIGLIQDARTEVLGLMWGSILFVRKESVVVIAAMAIILIIFTMIFNKELKLLMFSRSIAAATGMHDTFVYCSFLVVCGLILAVNLKTIGGLMIFSLITNPAAAAYQVCRGHRAVVITATLLGAGTAVIGFLISFYLGLPTGACIVIVSTMAFGLAVIYRRLKGILD